MTPDIFKPLHNAIIWAQHCADPLHQLWMESCHQSMSAMQRRALTH